MKSLCLLLIRCYQKYISPFFPPTCRYIPSCSQYAIDAISLHGLVKGGWMAFCRILRCHPLHSGGYDPVNKNDT